MREIRLHIDCEVCLHGIPDEIEIIFDNLISKAVKYNIPGGKADIMICWQDGQSVTPEFRDTGIGDPSRGHEKPVYRVLPDQITGETKGIQCVQDSASPIVKKIVDIYKGSIDVESKPGEGSTFTIAYFPCRFQPIYPKPMNSAKNLPEKTIESVSQYRRVVAGMPETGGKFNIHIRTSLPTLLHLNPVQVRRDIMLIGREAEPLAKGTMQRNWEIRPAPSSTAARGQKAAVVGVGNLGRAIMTYFQGKRTKLSNAAALFDTDPAGAR
ncbi:MAG: ATP-binding protein [Candidatus Moduliflexus flocculans]|nr:ATP-binding protein [Candidatus Moduliflexus flocculans]